MGQFEEENIFEVLNEGGEMKILRRKDPKGVKFFYQYNEFDPTEEGLIVKEKSEFNDFESAFRVINEKHPWYMLHIEKAHSDYRDIIMRQLTEKLQNRDDLQEDLDEIRNRLERAFQDLDESEKQSLT